MKTFSILSILLFFQGISTSQTWVWQQQATNQTGAKLVADKQHNWYSWSADSSSISKFDPCGTILFKKTLVGLKISNVICASDSGFFVAGNFTSSATVESTVIADPGNAFLVVRYDKAGALVWITKGSATGGAGIRDICLTANGLALVGTAADTMVFGNTVIPKSTQPEMFHLNIDLLANILSHSIAKVAGNQWTPLNQARTAGLEIESDGAGNTFVLAAFHGNVSIDTNSFGNLDFYNEPTLLKFNSSCQLQWARFLNYSNKDNWHSLRVSNAGEAYLIKDIGSQYGISHSDILKYSSGGQHIPFFFLIGMNEGMYGWNRWFRDIQLDSCSNLYVTGFVHGWFPLDTVSETRYYLLNMQVSPSAQVLWKSIDSSYVPRSGTGLSVLAPNLMLVAGYFRDSIKLQSTQFGNHLVPTSAGTWTLGFFQARLHTTVGAPQNVTPPGKQQVCENATAVLTATANAAVSWYSTAVLGSPAGSGFTFTVPINPPGTYTYYAEANSCTITTARIPVTLTVQPLPQVAVNNGTVCSGVTYTLSPTGAYSYTFSSGTAVVTPSASTLYYITGSSVAGCTAGVVCQVSVVPLPLLHLHSTANFMCAGETATLSCSGASSYTWSSGPISPTLAVSPVANHVYSVQGLDQNGCVGTGTIMQYVFACSDLAEHQKAVTISPNPAQDRLHVDTPHEATLFICDAAGQVVYVTRLVGGSNPLDIRQLIPGMYLLRIESAQSTMVRRVVVQ